MISKLKITLAVAAVVLATIGCNSLIDLNNSLASVNDSLAQVNDKLSSPSTTTTGSKSKDDFLVCYDPDSKHYYRDRDSEMLLGTPFHCNKNDKVVKFSEVPPMEIIMGN